MSSFSISPTNVFRAQAKPSSARDLFLSPVSLVIIALATQSAFFIWILATAVAIHSSDAIIYGAAFTGLSLVISGAIYKTAQVTDVSWRQLHRWRAKSLTITWTIDDLNGTSATRTNDAVAESLLNNNAYWYELSWGDGDEVFSSPLGHHDTYPWKDKFVYVVRLRNPARKGQTIHHTTTTRLTDAFRDTDQWVSAYTLYSRPAPFRMCVVFPVGAKISNQRLEYYRGGIRRTEMLDLASSGERLALSVEIKEVTPRNMYYIKWSWDRETGEISSSPDTALEN